MPLTSGEPPWDTRPLWLRPFSGRYENSTSGGPTMVLRIDIDVGYANSPVLKCVSGDLYKIFYLLYGPVYTVYDKSWIVTDPTINITESKAEITGLLKFWKNPTPTYKTMIQISIPRGHTYVGPATVTLTPDFDASSFLHDSLVPAVFICNKKSGSFREINLELDVTKSVNKEPILPKYQTASSTHFPSYMPKRTLTIQRAYRDAGVYMKVNPEHTIIDDSTSSFVAWDDSELHDAMESYFSKYSLNPTWNLWSMLCGTYEDPSDPEVHDTLGIMFDVGGKGPRVYGGGTAPYRQGFAIFRNNSHLKDLVLNPTNHVQAEAMRLFLMVYVHESGHTFNLMHSFDKGRKDALSWMNYPFRYPDGENQFWNLFDFQFDTEELVHIRHGDRSSVIMGGDPYTLGGHLESSNSEIFISEGHPPLELSLSSTGYFDYLEPVGIEIRVRNLLDRAILIDRRLNPEYGTLEVYIKRPNETIVRYLPVIYKEGTPNLLALQSHNCSIQGEDRFSDYVNITYGKQGFYFDEPGEYSIRAVYSTADLVIPSNYIRVRVGYPTSNEESRIAYDFFTYEVGMILYLNGSESPFLSAGKKLLESISGKYPTTLVGVKISSTLAASEGRPFFRVQDNVLVQTHKPNYGKALNLTESGLEIYRKRKDKHLNIQYHHLVRRRADYLTTMGKKKNATDELSDLRKNLAARGVNESVLKSIEVVQKSLNKGKRST